MLKNVIGAVVGSKLAPQTPATGSAAGAVLATAVPFVLSRFTLPTLVALGTGGYLVKRYLDKRENDAVRPMRDDERETASQMKRAKTPVDTTAGTAGTDATDVGAPKYSSANGSATGPVPVTIGSN